MDHSREVRVKKNYTLGLQTVGTTDVYGPPDRQRNTSIFCQNTGEHNGTITAIWLAQEEGRMTL